MSLHRTPERRPQESRHVIGDERMPTGGQNATHFEAPDTSLINFNEQPTTSHGEKAEITDIRNVKLPPFWIKNPRLWFLQVDAQFRTHRITSDATRYGTVIAKLEMDVLQQVSDLVESPPLTDKYQALKDALIERFSESKQKQLNTLLSEMELGDKKPSQLHREMKTLAGDIISTEALRTLWLQRMPSGICCALAASEDIDLTKLTTIADRMLGMSARNNNRVFEVEAIAKAEATHEQTFQRSKHLTLFNPEAAGSAARNVGRVGVESCGTPLLNSRNATAETPSLNKRETFMIVRPYYATGDSGLSGGELPTTELGESESTTGILPASVNRFPSWSELRVNRSRCQPVRTTFRSYRDSYLHNHDMNRTDASDNNVPNSGSSSSEPYTCTVQHDNEEGSSDEDSKHENGSRAYESSLRHVCLVKEDLWADQLTSFPGPLAGSTRDMASVVSFSSSTGVSGTTAGTRNHRRLGAKVDVVYSLLGMLGSTEGQEDMSATLLAMSNSIDSCLVMRQSGCLPLLVQLIHAPGQDHDTRERASGALHNVIHARSDEKVGRREARVLRLLEQVRDYCQALRASLESVRPPDDLERHPGPTIAALMKLSFDEAHRHAMCQLGGLHAISELIEMDHASHGSASEDSSCVTLRRYAGMALTNLTFGDGNNKALLCSFRAFMMALVSQLQSLSDDLRQVTASVLRNLSWRADSSSKQTLREIGAVTGLMRAAMEGRKESTLKSILSALWNLSAHCSTNKVDICGVEGALAFLVDMLSYEAPSKTLSIVENAGGILRNVSSHIAVREDYRKIVRERGCLQVLLRQLRSPSLTVVSNACGALWNLSARCPHDQLLLWDLGAVPMLRSLVHSKHKMISMGSSAALKNLLSARPAGSNLVHLDSTARGLGLPTLPTLVVRRQRALEQEIDQNLAETCDNIEPSTSPINRDDKFSFKVGQSYADVGARAKTHPANSNNSSASKYALFVPRSDSRESMRSVTSTHSDTIFERVNRHVTNDISIAETQSKQSSSLHSAVGFNAPAFPDPPNRANQTERKYALRYKNPTSDRRRPMELGASETGDLRCTTSTVSWTTAPNQESACSQILTQSSIEDSISMMCSSKAPVGRVGADFSKKPDDPSARNTRNNYRSPLVSPPIGKLSFATGFATTPITSCDRPIEKDVRSPAYARAPGTDPFDAYAETDLDELTNYSLRYAERNSDEDEKHGSTYGAGSDHRVEDTGRTYCTEGTHERSNSQNLHPKSITNIACEMRRESYQESSTFPNSQRRKGNFHTSPNRTANNASTLPDSFHRNSDVPSESWAHSDPFVMKNSHMSPRYPQSFTLDSDVDSASSTETTVMRLNSFVLNDNPRIINHSMADDSKSIPKSDSRNVEFFPNSIVSDEDDDDEDLLAACIHIGMQNNRHRRTFRRNSLDKTPSTESNLARYETSLALDQVEANRSTEHAEPSSQSKSPRFNIATVPSTEYRQTDPIVNGYTSFEDNFNVAKDDDKITVEYQKLQEYSCDQEKETTSLDEPSIRITGESAILAESTKRELRADSVEDNRIHDENVNDSASQSDSGSNRETRDSESMESFDSVERSEQALLQLCIKSGASKNDAIPMSASNLISRDATAVENSIFCKIDDNFVARANAMTADRCSETCEDAKLRESRDNKSKNVETMQNVDEYRRQRDPDAMIASLDRLTATLVQQTEAMRERELSAMRQSVLSDTWTEDSPNEASYPSISVSAPFIASFKSDVEQEIPLAETVSPLREVELLESSLMTNSRIIEREAIKLAEAVSAEASRERTNCGSCSPTSIDLEATRASSNRANFILAAPCDIRESVSDHQNHCQSNSLSPTCNEKQNRDLRSARKKSLPVGVMAKRALSHGVNHAGSLESLLNGCSLGTNSQLENVMPPSLMDELFDNTDMENSMISVASITSEIADSKDQDSISLTSNDPIFDLVQPVANVLSITCMRYAASMHTSANDSISECLENINPPSLLNEVSEMEDSTFDANTDTMCSDTLCIDAELMTEETPRSIAVDRIEESDNDADEICTSVATESSAESTPRKRSHKSRLTPKQKRQSAKERFKTYTIAAELVKKEENERRWREQTDAGVCKLSPGKCSPFSKLTPKQRRQEDPARFQTQVLTNPFPNIADLANAVVQDGRSDNPEVLEISPKHPSVATMSNVCGGRTFSKKRTEKEENADVAEDLEAVSLETTEERIANETESAGCEAMQTMLEQNANVVLHTLNETTRHVDANVEDAMLDCETLSLVSNDSESEHSLRMRVAGGLGRKLLTQKASQQTLVSRSKESEIAVKNYIRESDERIGAMEETSKISDSESDENSFCNVGEQVQETKRPRIVKPDTVSRDRSVDSEGADKSEPGSPKGIRGRRKALYSTPNARKNVAQTSPLKQACNPTGIPIGRSNTSPVVRATRATMLRQNTNVVVNTGKDASKANFLQKLPQSSPTEKRSRNTALAKRSSIPQRGSNHASTKFVKRHSTPPASGSTIPHKEVKADALAYKPLERQGTFTKDEPEVQNAPTVHAFVSPTKSKFAKPSKGSPVRVNPVGQSKILVRTQGNAQQSRLVKCSSTERMQPSRTSPSHVGRKAAESAASRSQVDQAVVQSTPTDMEQTTKRSTRLGQRSNSNSSIVSSSTAVVAGRKLPKEATSKIASLWKKVDERKNKQRFEKPDMRQWITATPAESADFHELAVTRKIPAFRLFRSSTFEGVPKESDDATIIAAAEKPTRTFEDRASVPKYRNSCDLTGMAAVDAPCKIPVKSSNKRASGKEGPVNYGTIVLRKQRSVDSNGTTEIGDMKRISRLGSFIRVEASDVDASVQMRSGDNLVRTPVSAIVPPFNYNPRQEASAVTTKTKLNEDDGYIDEFKRKIVTSSTKVTTV